MLVNEMTEDQYEVAVDEARNQGYCTTYSYEGDLVAFNPTDGWADYDLYQTHLLLEGCQGYVIAWAK